MVLMAVSEYAFSTLKFIAVAVVLFNYKSWPLVYHIRSFFAYRKGLKRLREKQKNLIYTSVQSHRLWPDDVSDFITNLLGRFLFRDLTVISHNLDGYKFSHEQQVRESRDHLFVLTTQIQRVPLPFSSYNKLLDYARYAHVVGQWGTPLIKKELFLHNAGNHFIPLSYLPSDHLSIAFL